MTDLIYSFIAWNLIIYLFVLTLKLFKLAEINVKWLLLSTGLFRCG